MTRAINRRSGRCGSPAPTTRRPRTTAPGSSWTACGPAGFEDAAALDEWCKDIAPSTDLRRWYAHRPEAFDEFARRYRAELATPEARAALARIAERAEHESVTLLTASKAVDISDAAVLRDLIAGLPD